MIGDVTLNIENEQNIIEELENIGKQIVELCAKLMKNISQTNFTQIKKFN